MYALDLCSGTKSATKAMADRDWTVVTVDINPDLQPNIAADIRYLSIVGATPDLIWASPPCVEFTRSFLPWLHSKAEPDMSVVQACKRIKEAQLQMRMPI